jgi:hypothetical protein
MKSVCITIYVGIEASLSHNKKHFISLHKITWSISFRGTKSTKGLFVSPELG